MEDGERQCQVLSFSAGKLRRPGTTVDQQAPAMGTYGASGMMFLCEKERRGSVRPQGVDSYHTPRMHLRQLGRHCAKISEQIRICAVSKTSTQQASVTHP